MNAKRSNILLVVLDSVRSKNTSLSRTNQYNNTTPEIHALTEQATQYKNAIAPGTASLQSHTSIFTGLEVAQHGVNSGKSGSIPDTIWEILRSSGYALGVFSHNPYLTQTPFGFSDLFDHIFAGNPRGLPFADAAIPQGIIGDGLTVYWQFIKRAFKSGSPIRSLCNGAAAQLDSGSVVPFSLRNVTGAEITDAFIHWQDTQTDPWAACLNYMDAHTPYVSDPQYSIEATSEECYLAESINNYVWEFITETRPLTDLSLLEAPYNDCIRQVDAEVGRLIQELADHDVLEQTLVVVTADHGEGFGEPGTARSVPSIGHGGTGGPEEGVLRIPLVVKFPNQTESVIVEKPASLTRFPCVVRTVLNGDHDPLAFVPDGFALASGLGLSPSEMEAKPASVTASEYDQPFRAAYEWTEQDELRKHVVCGGAALSFDVTDPTDVRSIESVDTATIVQNAFEELEAVETLTDDPTDEIDPATEQRLEYLGYR